ncbi:MAG: DUF6252 family protein [Bacteroidota bacterium]|nr:DUF6252 family protein [Bacteroidota bacterium]
MKKYLLGLGLLCTTFLVMVSCYVEPLAPGVKLDPLAEEEIRFKVSMQDTVFVADTVRAEVQSGTIRVIARNTGLGRFNLKVNGVNLGEYTNESAEIIYTNIDHTAIYTNTNPDTGSRTATIRITSIDYENKKISGTFSFLGYKQGSNHTLLFTDGAFTNVSYN